MVTPVYNEPACSQAACHAHPAEIKVLGVLDVDLDLQTVDAQLAGVKWRAFLFTLIHILLIGIFIVLFTRRFVAFRSAGSLRAPVRLPRCSSTSPFR